MGDPSVMACLCHVWSVRSCHFMVSCVGLCGCDYVVRIFVRLGSECVWVCCLCEFDPLAVGFRTIFS
jgi:hypothetical protein